jgi:hypothetical protein
VNCLRSRGKQCDSLLVPTQAPEDGGSGSMSHTSHQCVRVCYFRFVELNVEYFESVSNKEEK